MTVNSLVLIEGENLKEETLGHLSLVNAKQVLVGKDFEFGVILSIGANDLIAINKALSIIGTSSRCYRSNALDNPKFQQMNSRLGRKTLSFPQMMKILEQSGDWEDWVWTYLAL